MKPKLEIFKSKEELAQEFANLLLKLCQQKDQVNIALSGGNTPKAIFDVLALEYRAIIQWEKIRLFWVDERCVTPDDSDSNYGMTRDHLLEKVPISSTSVFRIPAEKDPIIAAHDYSTLLRSELPLKNGLPLLDLTVLGMGDDGHTASIFPHEMYLWNSHNLCEIATHPQSGQKRITLTGSTINNSAKIIFLVTGNSKAKIAAEIITKTGNYLKYPASLVKKSKSLWYMDQEAAQALTEH